MTLLGTIRKNKRELPQEFANPPRSRSPLSSIFAFQKNVTLVSYIPKKGKNVLLVSGIHYEDEIDDNTNKPEIIMDYNRTKGGVDCVDKLCAAYDVSRNTRRWPMVVFYSLINVAGINSFIIYSTNNSTWNTRRRKFLQTLSFQLVEDHLRRRLIQNIPNVIKDQIRRILAVPPPPPQLDVDRRGRCAYCDRKKNRPTRFTCVKCEKFICLEHSLNVCRECSVLDNDSE